MKTTRQLPSRSALRDPRSSKNPPEQSCSLYSLCRFTFASGRKLRAKTACGKPRRGRVQGYTCVDLPSLSGGEQRYRKRQKTIKGEIQGLVFMVMEIQKRFCFSSFCSHQRSTKQGIKKKKRDKTACLRHRQGVGHPSGCLLAKGLPLAQQYCCL